MPESHPPTAAAARPARIHVAIGPTLRRELLAPSTVEALNSLGEVTFQDADRRHGLDELAVQLRGCRVVLTGWSTPLLTSAVLAAAPGLELVSHTGVSVWKQADESLFRAGVRVTCAGDAMVVPVAEFTLMQILRAVREPNAASAPSTLWPAPPTGELAGLVVGIVGAGKIGQRVIRLLRAFEARVLLCDPFVTAADAVAMGATLTDLPSLLRQSAVVSLHAPAAPATRHMIAAAQLAAMRDGAWLINTARASLVDTGALVAELRSGRLFAALDVFDEEPLPPGSPLRGLPHARLTPHCAFITHPCLHRMGSAAVEEVRRFLSGEPLANEVTLAQRDRLA